MAKMSKEEIRIEEITMQLVHYFITRENYQPILVNGVNNEIWLENSERKYQVIRINYNYIHNKEQLEFDIFKAKSILKQIKKKTLSFNLKSLTILLNTNDSVKLESNDKNITIETINNLNNIYSGNNLLEIFPDIKDDYIESQEDIDPYINLAIDINKKTNERNILFEKLFTKVKPLVMTIIGILIIIGFAYSNYVNMDLFKLNVASLKQGEWYRYITSILLNNDFYITLVALYSISILGQEIESIFGRLKAPIIFVFSCFFAELFTSALYPNIIVNDGIIGGVMGIIGALCYIGFFFRPYFSMILKTKLLPVTVLNLLLLLVTNNLTIMTILGGLVGGLFIAMIFGIKGKTEKSDQINGFIVTISLLTILFLLINR